jgi:hypothetical protein
LGLYNIFTGVTAPSTQERRIKMNKNVLLEWTKDITVSALSKNEHTLNEPVGDGVADFMQKVYDKLVQLSENNSN